MEKGWYILLPFGLYYGRLVHLMAVWPFGERIWNIFPRFGKLCREKSGNPGTYHYQSNSYKVLPPQVVVAWVP
jgi:hypothetical protein